VNGLEVSLIRVGGIASRITAAARAPTSAAALRRLRGAMSVDRQGELWLGEVADRNGLAAGFSQALASAPPARPRRDSRAATIVSAVTVIQEEGGAIRL
jgi:hypothetical protein